MILIQYQQPQGAVERDQGLDHAEDHDAQQRAHDVPAATGEQGAADDDRRDRVELDADRVQAVSRQDAFRFLLSRRKMAGL